DLVPIPGVVRVILEMPLDCPRGDVDRDGRGSIEIIARTLIAHPGAPVPDSPKSEVSLGIVVAGYPDRAATGLPLVAFGPGLAAGLAWSGYRIGPPQLPARIGIECRDEPANSIIATRCSHHHLTIP